MAPLRLLGHKGALAWLATPLDPARVAPRFLDCCTNAGRRALISGQCAQGVYCAGWRTWVRDDWAVTVTCPLRRNNCRGGRGLSPTALTLLSTRPCSTSRPVVAFTPLAGRGTACDPQKWYAATLPSRPGTSVGLIEQVRWL